MKDKSSATEQYMSGMSPRNTKLSSFHSKQFAIPKHGEEKDIVDWTHERIKEFISKKDKITEIKSFLSSKSTNSAVFTPTIHRP